MIAKRALDLLVAGVLVVLVSPFLLAAAIAIKVEERGPVFFRQERVGRDGRPFRIWKFRTMEVGAEKKGAGYLVSEGDTRITRVGRFLRKWSLDELPQLFNILKGDMSVVGPRPTLAYQVEQYTPEQRRRLEVPPGVTGWAQIRGRNGLTWPERIELDVWYVDHRSLGLDLKILVKTVGVVVKPDEVYNDARGDWGEDATTPEGEQAPPPPASRERRPG